ncbi:biotin/lipoyl-containing protein [Aquicoccus sp. G2-2]|uniref:biotin/lipoyl-containing protein n=1 Tax=Aquicoccus sp. G2-2 TaxID=3092120 RepID=UPI002AE04F8E|nr:biotin/lipoyl-containing protein [Aquicoccus sp. G2-2]MEA1114811.1 biotin/lipoyl-containing protein [Aquicoccus sp. G2-2]
MGQHTIKVPDVGEGIAEVELAEWHVAVGDVVREDQVLAAVMTDKATVEIPSPSDGTVLWLGAAPGDKMAVKSPLIRLEVAGEGNTETVAEVSDADAPAAETPTDVPPEPSVETPPKGTPKEPDTRPLPAASPAPGNAHLPRPEGKNHWRPRRSGQGRATRG